MKTLSGKVIRLALLVLVLLALGVSAQAGEWKVNYVVVAGSGQIEVLAPDGTVIDSKISTGTNGRVGGCVFASSYVLRCVDYDNLAIVKFALQDPHAPTQTISLSASSPNPQSVLYMDGPTNNLLVGFAGGTLTKYDYTGTLKANFPCGPVTTDSSTTFWMQIGGDNKTVFYTSGAGKNGKGTLRQFSLSGCPSPKVSSVFPSLSQPLYGLLALPNGSGVVDGSGGFIIAVGSDILQVNSAGTTVQTYAALAGEASNDWRAVWPTADGSAFVAVNLATGNLFEFRILNGANTAKKLAGPIPTINVNTPDEVGGVTVFGAFDAAQAQPQINTLTLTSAAATSNTGSLSFSDVPACCKDVKPNTVTITLNGIPAGVTDTATIRFTEIAPVVGTSDTGLACFLADQEGKECVTYEIEVSPSTGTIGFKTYDLLFFSPQASTNPVLLKNEAVDVTTLLAQDETIDGTGGGGFSVFTTNQLPGGVLTSSGWLAPIFGTAQNAIKIGQNLKIQFSIPAPPASFNCSSTLNCPFVTISVLRDGQAPTGFCPPGGVPVEGGTGTGATACGLIFRVIGSTATSTTLGGNWDTGTATDGCYILTGHDPFNRFNIFSYAQSSAPLTTLIRIGDTATVQECTALATQVGMVIQ